MSIDLVPVPSERRYSLQHGGAELLSLPLDEIKEFGVLHLLEKNSPTLIPKLGDCIEKAIGIGAHAH